MSNEFTFKDIKEIIQKENMPDDTIISVCIEGRRVNIVQGQAIGFCLMNGKNVLLLHPEFMLSPQQMREYIEKYCSQGKPEMTKEKMVVFDGKLSEYIKGLKEFESKDEPHAYTQSIREVTEDLYRLQDRVREDSR